MLFACPLPTRLPNFLSPSLTFLCPVALLSFKSGKTQPLDKSDSPTYLFPMPTPSLPDAAEEKRHHRGNQWRYKMIPTPAGPAKPHKRPANFLWSSFSLRLLTVVVLYLKSSPPPKLLTKHSPWTGALRRVCFPLFYFSGTWGISPMVYCGAKIWIHPIRYHNLSSGITWVRVMLWRWVKEGMC